jgi:hypothetical protein
MKIGIARFIFALQGIFLLFTSLIFLLSPATLSAPGEQFEGTADDVAMNFGYVTIAFQETLGAYGSSGFHQCRLAPASR